MLQSSGICELSHIYFVTKREREREVILFADEKASERTEMIVEFLNPQNVMLLKSNCMYINPSLIKKVLMTPLIFREVCT